MRFTFLTTLMILGVQLTNAQNWSALEQHILTRQARIDSLNESGFSTRWNFNRGFGIPNLLASMADLKGGVDGQNQLVFAGYTWQKYWYGLRQSPRRGEASELEPAYPIIEEYLQNEIPMGCIGTRGEWLTEEQVEQNLADVRGGKESNQAYRQVSMLAAATLRSTVNSLTVTFVADKRLWLVEGPFKNRLSVDLGDGAGYRPLSPGQAYSTTYAYGGRKQIIFRWDTPQGPIFNQSLLQIDLPPSDPTWEWELGSSVSADTALAERGSLSGGTAQIRLSCDNYLDKPFIIVEGWDPLNQNGHAGITTKLAGPTGYGSGSPYRQLADHGYDIITLNWHDGAADIRSLAPSLEELLLRLQALKQGDHPITIMGVSMGGLVTRYCLTGMEQRGIDHQVGLFISYDSPHRGANYPVGFQKLFMGLDNPTLLNFFGIPTELFDQGRTALFAPASRQMLLRFLGPDPDADHTAFYQELEARGWPASRNIALVNGSSQGLRQSNTEQNGTFYPGQKIFDVDLLFGTVAGFMEVRTNKLNEWTAISNFTYWQFGLPPIPIPYGKNFGPLNYDLAPGGFQNQLGQALDQELELPAALRDFTLTTGDLFNLAGYLTLLLPIDLAAGGLRDYGRGQITFAPLFSTVASTENATFQWQIQRPVQQYLDLGLTPMEGIYSRDINSRHNSSTSIIEAIQELLNQELLIGPNGYCNSEDLPSMPNDAPLSIIGDEVVCNAEGQIHLFQVNDPEVGIENYYRYRWRLLQGSTEIARWDNFQGLPIDKIIINGGNFPSGYYTLELRRTLNVTFDSPPKYTSMSVTLLASGTAGCSEPIEGDPNCQNNLGEGDCQQRSLTVTPNPATEAITLTLPDMAGQSTTIQLIPVLKPQNYLTLYTGLTPNNSKEWSFPITQIPSGLYIVRVLTSETMYSQKVFIKP